MDTGNMKESKQYDTNYSKDSFPFSFLGRKEKGQKLYSFFHAS